MLWMVLLYYSQCNTLSSSSHYSWAYGLVAEISPAMFIDKDISFVCPRGTAKTRKKLNGAFIICEGWTQFSTHIQISWFDPFTVGYEGNTNHSMQYRRTKLICWLCLWWKVYEHKSYIWENFHILRDIFL